LGWLVDTVGGGTTYWGDINPKEKSNGSDKHALHKLDKTYVRGGKEGKKACTKCSGDGAERGEDERGNATEGMGDMRCGKTKKSRSQRATSFSLAGHSRRRSAERKGGRGEIDTYLRMPLGQAPWAANQMARKE